MDEKNTKKMGKEYKEIGDFFAASGGTVTMKDGGVEIKKNPVYTDLSVETPSITVRILGGEGTFLDKVKAAKELIAKAIEINRNIEFTATDDEDDINTGGTGVSMVA